MVSYYKYYDTEHFNFIKYTHVMIIYIAIGVIVGDKKGHFPLNFFRKIPTVKISNASKIKINNVLDICKMKNIIFLKVLHKVTLYYSKIHIFHFFFVGSIIIYCQNYHII